MTQIMFNPNDHMIQREPNRHDTFLLHILKYNIAHPYTYSLSSHIKWTANKVNSDYTQQCQTFPATFTLITSHACSSEEAK